MQKLTLSLTVLVFAFGARASEWALDPAHTSIGFSVRHMMVTDVHGAFDAYTGAVTLDDADVSKSKANIDIEVKSVNTKVQKRDDHLRSGEFFDAEHFPKMTFKSTKIEKGTAPGSLKITGDLTLHGVTKPIVLDATLSDAWTDPKDWGGNTHRGVKATGKINRQDFGLKWQKTLDKGGVVAGDEVTLLIDAELVQQAPKKS